VKNKPIYLLFFYLFISMLFSNSYAESLDKVCQEKSNKIFCGNGVLDQVNYLNDVVFNGTRILGHTNVLGDVNASHAYFNTLDMTGDFKGDDVVVAGDAKILGDIHLENVIFHANVNITGDVKASKVQFMSPSKIVGNLTCDNGSFNSDLILSSMSSTLTHTTTKNIEFTSDRRQQILYLYGATVNGSIKFSSNNGVIYSSEGSIITGNVIGGRVINQ